MLSDDSRDEIARLKNINNVYQRRVALLTESNASLSKKMRWMTDKTDENRNLAARVAVNETVIQQQRVKTSKFFPKIINDCDLLLN